MSRLNADEAGGAERRAAERHSCNPETVCQVIDLLDQGRAEAGAWNASTGGVSVLLGPHYKVGARLAIQLRNPEDACGLVLFAEVVHTLLVPSLREMWLTGCSFQGTPVSNEELRPYTS